MNKSIKRALYLLQYRRDAEGIARYLSKRGLLHCAVSSIGNCPVANYLIAETGAVAVGVGHISAEVTYNVIENDSGELLPDWSKTITVPQLPKAVSMFTWGFDRQDYLDLYNPVGEQVLPHGGTVRQTESTAPDDAEEAFVG